MYTLVVAHVKDSERDDSPLIREHLKKKASNGLRLNGSVSFSDIADVFDYRHHKTKMGVGIPLKVDTEAEARTLIARIEKNLPENYTPLTCYDRRQKSIDIGRNYLWI